MKGTYEAAKTSIASCMGAKSGEKLLILTDEDQMDLAREFVRAGNDLGVETVMASGPVRHSGEMPALSQAALAEADACICLLYTSCKRGD